MLSALPQLGQRCCVFFVEIWGTPAFSRTAETLIRHGFAVPPSPQGRSATQQKLMVWRVGRCGHRPLHGLQFGMHILLKPESVGAIINRPCGKMLQSQENQCENALAKYLPWGGKKVAAKRTDEGTGSP
jgi:hypothetical protein